MQTALNPTQIDQYQNEGWLIVEDFLTADGYDPIVQTARITASEDFSTAHIRLTVRDPDDHRAERVLHLGLPEKGDFNSDTAIDLNDFFRLVGVFGTVADTPEWDGTADPNSDGLIDFDDFFVFIDQYEKSDSWLGD